MLKNFYKNNFILFSVNNLKKTLFNFYKINSTFNSTNLNYFVSKNNVYFILSFELKNYFFEKEAFINILNIDAYHYDIISVKYKNKFCSLEYFENIIIKENIQVFEDLAVYLYIIMLNKLIHFKLFMFLNYFVYNNLNSLLKCLLFTKQHQN